MNSTKNYIIVKQIIKINRLKKELQHKKDIIRDVKGMLISIGQPLNDNKLQFNDSQLKWAAQLNENFK